MRHTMSAVRGVLAATEGQGPVRQGRALFDYWQANLGTYVAKDAEMTNDRWNDAVIDHSLAPAALGFLLPRDVFEVFDRPLWANLEPVHPTAQATVQQGTLPS